MELRPTSARTRALLSDVRAIVSHASERSSDRDAYSRDLWPRHVIGVRKGIAAPNPPALVAWPSSTNEVADLVRFAEKHSVELVPYGAGSGVCAGISPRSDSIVVDLKRMRRIEIDSATFRVHAQPGVIGQILEDRLLEAGFTLGHYPSSIHCSTVGGWLAARSAGQCSGRYGKIEDMATRIECVIGGGEILSADFDQDSAAFDRSRVDRALAPLLIGSEGTLGIITDSTLAISPKPGDRIVASFSFPSFAAGIDALRQIYQLGLRPAVARLYDPFDTMMARRGRVKKRIADPSEAKARTRFKLPGPAAALRSALRMPALLNRIVDAVPDDAYGGSMMVLLWEDDPRLASAERDEVRRIAGQLSADDLGPDPAMKWLGHRHSVSYRQSVIFANGGFVDTMEVSAPWSRIYGTYEAVREALAPHAFVMAHSSHSYPDGGSLYFTFAGAAKDDDKAEALYDQTWRAALAAAQSAGASISHHHGVGRSKAPRMTSDQGAANDVVRALKHTLDPRNIFNVGALLHDAPSARSSFVSPANHESHTTRESFNVAFARAYPGTVDLAARTVAPTNVADLCALVRFAWEYGGELRTPGGVARQGDIVVDLTVLRQETEVDATSGIARTPAGVQMQTLVALLRERGLELPRARDVPAKQTVGEWIEGGLGTTNVVDPLDQILCGLEAVLPDGTPLAIRPAPRRAVGPDLLSAWIGSRGQLGIAHTYVLSVQPTRATHRLWFTFKSEASAHRARNLLRAKHARTDSFALLKANDDVLVEIRIRATAHTSSGSLDVIRDLMRTVDGREITSDQATAKRLASGENLLADTEARSVASPDGSIVARLARELDPRGVFSVTRRS